MNAARLKARVKALAHRGRAFLRRQAETRWGGRPLIAYHRMRAASAALLAAMRAPRPAPALAPPRPSFTPPAAIDALPRGGAALDPQQIRDAAAALPADLNSSLTRALLIAIADVAEPAASLLRGEILARAGAGEHALAMLWSAPPRPPLSELGLTALAPLARDRRAALAAEADQALSAGRFSRASECYRLALALEPSADLAHKLARALRGQGRTAEADAALARFAAGADA